MTSYPILLALVAALQPHGGQLLSLDGDVARIEIAGRSSEVFLDNLRRRVANGEPFEEAVAAFVAVEVGP